jgi:hypothetical protein
LSEAGVSVMSAAEAVVSAAEAPQVAGAGQRIVVPKPRAAASGPVPGTPGGARHRPQGGAPRAGSETLRPSSEPSLRVRELQVSELRMTRVRAVETAGRGGQATRIVRTAVRAGPASVRRESAVRRASVAGAQSHRAALGGVRLTRRGRVVAAGFVVLVAVAAIALIWLTAADGAAASDRGSSARSVYQGLTQVVVQPGQTLWSIAAAAEPSADPRLVIQQIAQVNALAGATIHAGQLLWVPTG